MRQRRLEDYGVPENSRPENTGQPLYCDAQRSISLCEVSTLCGTRAEKGHRELAEVFEKTANTERFEHFTEEVKFTGLVPL